ncbi:efflux RND transporter periplasmic adaptor subunit [Chitinophagaceae bacterium MMS25-I14]
MRSLIVSSLFIFLYGCSSQQNAMQAPPPQNLPVIKINAGSATTYTEYPASVEGTVNVEIRPQVSGYIDKIYVEEGAYVSQGQPLFKINDNLYSQQSNNAGATIQAARAALEKAQVELDRIKPLVENKVVSDVQLQTAKASYNEAKAALAQATAAKGSADVSLGYTLIKAPVSGYIGRIPYKTGSLIGRGEALPLTVLSEVRNMYAYFSMSESEFLKFTGNTSGKTLEEKIKQVPPVELQLPDNSIYGQKGKLELVEGQFDRTTGTISLRAVFPNDQQLLRSGLTAKIRVPATHDGLVVIPQESTYEMQDKIFVFALGDSNKVVSKHITVGGKSGNYYLIADGLKTGETIVYSGIQRLRDGNMIVPQPISLDSLLHADPL